MTIAGNVRSFVQLFGFLTHIFCFCWQQHIYLSSRTTFSSPSRPVSLTYQVSRCWIQDPMILLVLYQVSQACFQAQVSKAGLLGHFLSPFSDANQRLSFLVYLRFRIQLDCHCLTMPQVGPYRKSCNPWTGYSFCTWTQTISSVRFRLDYVPWS